MKELQEVCWLKLERSQGEQQVMRPERWAAPAYEQPCKWIEGITLPLIIPEDV